MVCNMDLLNLTSIVKPVKEVNLTNTQINTNNEFINICEDVLGTTKEDFFTYCAISKIDTLSDYINTRPNLNTTLTLSAEDYKTEFKDYMTSRGCENQAELTALNSVKDPGMITKQQVLQYAGGIIAQTSGFLHESGFSADQFLPPDETNSILSSANFQDVADFVNTDIEGKGTANTVAAYQTLIDKVASYSSTNEILKNRLTQASSEISTSKDAIFNLCGEIDKAAEAQSKLNAEFEIQKYNVS